MTKFQILYLGKSKTTLIIEVDDEKELRKYMKCIEWKWLLIKRLDNNEFIYCLPIENYIKAHIL